MALQRFTFWGLATGIFLVVAQLLPGCNFPFLLIDANLESLYFRGRGPILPDPDIVILAIDQDSLRLQELFEKAELARWKQLNQLRSWPWPRSIYAQIIRKLISSGAQTIALDLAFEGTSPDPQEDKVLAQTLEEFSKQIVLATHISVQRTSNPLFDYTALSSESPSFALPKGIRVGTVDYPVEANQQVFAISTNRDLRPFANAIADLPAQESDLGIQYSGPSGTYPTYPIWWLFEPSFWRNNLQSGKVFRGKIVLIGSTAEALPYRIATPVDLAMPRVELHANVLATLRQHRGIQHLSPLIRSLLALSMSILVGWLLMRVERVTWKLLLLIVLSTVLFAVGYLSFLHLWMLPISSMAGAILLTGFLDLTSLSIQEQLNRLRLRKILDLRVAPSVLAEILAQPETFAQTLGGKSCQVAVLFSDLRGFTALSAQLSPQEVVALLNRYFACIVKPILEEKGTLDKFIGDAIMAEFGTPVFRGEAIEALAAVTAALNMRKVLAELRAELKHSGKPLLFSGIGINFGEVVAGNIGSAQQLEYTVIGDAVNIAARIEGLTKTLGYDILVSESVYMLVKEQISVQFLGSFTLAGRESPIVLYALIDWATGSGELFRQVQAEYVAFQQSHSSKASS